MRWWHHLAVAGALTLLYSSLVFAIAGGTAFGIGVIWWWLGRYYDHSLKAWWQGDEYQS